MPIHPTDIAVLSRLLDEALDIDVVRRETWLAGLPTEQQQLVPKLRQMLAESDSRKTSGFLSSLPVMEEETSHDEAVAQPGELIGPYCLIREIGRGGMGAVWLAERADGAFKRQVALKLPRLAWGAGLAKRMARERDIGAMLEHPNIARLYDAGVDDKGRPYMALEYIDGVAIDVWCKDKKLSVRDKLQLIVQVAKAVAYAHGRLIVHRDLKPSNVLVSADGQVHLLDFGISRLLDVADGHDTRQTLEHSRAMTPSYASPEQFKGEAVTVQSDLYSLGVLMYELLAGTTPHDQKRKSAAALEEAILQGDAAPPSARVTDKSLARQLKGDIDAIVGKALKVDVSQRYATTEAMASDIERHLRGETVTARPDSRSYRWKRTLVRHRVGFTVSAAVVAVTLGLGGAAAWQAFRATQAAAREQQMAVFLDEVFSVGPAVPAAPARSGPRELTGDALIQRAGDLVAARFEGQPHTQAAMFSRIARTLIEMGAGAQALDFANRHSTQLDRSGAVAAARFDAVLLRAEAALEARKYSESTSLARQALTMPDTSPMQRATTYSVLARSTHWSGDQSSASGAIREIELLARQLGHPSIAEAWAHSVHGSLSLSLGQPDEFDKRWDKGIAMALEVEGEDSLALAQMRELRSFQLVTVGRAQEAKEIAKLAYDAQRRRGAISALRADVNESLHAVRLFQRRAATYQETRAVVDRARASVNATRSAPEAIRDQVDRAEGMLAMDWGDLELAARLLLPAAERLSRALESPFSKAHLLFARGRLLIDRGDHEAAIAAAEERFELRAAMGETSNPWSVYDTIVLTSAMSMAGDHDQALRRLDAYEAGPTLPPEPEGRYVVREPLRWQRITLLADAGRMDEAWRLAMSPPTGLSGDAAHQAKQLGSIEVYARLLCHQGRYREGRAILDAELEKDMADRYPHAPQFTRTRALAGICALGMADRDAAIGYAELARASFRIQPVVSPYYKLPLVHLEAELARDDKAGRRK